MSRSRLVPLALMVTLLLAVVAIAAHGRPLGGSSGGGRGGLPVGFWDYTYTTIVIAVVPLMLLGIVAAAFARRRQGKQRSYWQSLFQSLAVWAAFAVLAVLFERELKRNPLNPLNLRLHVNEPNVGPSGRGKLGGHHHDVLVGTRAPRFQWGELAILVGLLLVAGAIVAVWLSRRESKTPRKPAPEVLAAALDDSLDDLRTDPDVRRAIIAAYARMETALAAAGMPRHPAEAPLEYVERALLSLDTSAGAVRRLTDLFEWARFSHHEPEPSMRDDAVDALVAVRDELRAAELTPA